MATQLKEPETPPVEEGQGNDNEVQTQTRDFEAEARAQGWRPRDEFPGDPAKWTDAETFVRRGEEVLPFIKKENASLKRELNDLKRLTKRLMRSEQERAESARADLEARIDEATEAGDVAASKRLRTEVEKLTAQVQEGQTHNEDPAEHVLAFREENPWYDKGALASASEVEVEARLFADRTADRWIAQGKPKTMPPSQFYAELAEAVNERFPMLKHKPARAKPPSDVAGMPTRTAAPRNQRGYDQLPPEAKRQCDRFIANGTIKSREAYVSKYQWD